MARRLEIQTLLEDLLGTRNVYFQPPPTAKMAYPCLVYELDFETVQHADNLPYQVHRRWQVTSIDRDPDSLIPEKLSRLPKSTFNRFYRADGLNHTVYQIYF